MDKQQTADDDAYPLLSSISGAADLRQLDSEQLEELAAEIRQRLISVTSVNGGHLGPNLGVVELTLALHLVFDTPQDQFVFDNFVLKKREQPNARVIDRDAYLKQFALD